MAAEAYRTVEEPAEAAFSVNGSRFICLVAPAASESAVRERVETVAAAHPDATHVVSAYRLLGHPVVEGADDAGEPGGSAGKPALEVLRGEELLDVVAVVVRYYGGTNLGFGGLVRAYARAVSEAIAAASVVERVPTRGYVVEVAYDDSGRVRSVLESSGVDFDAEYTDRVTFAVTVEVEQAPELLERLRSATSGRAAIARRDVA
ncbi:MAG: IMPACT family protein [Halobacteriota archaeon]